jgi:hypothetical protein
MGFFKRLFGSDIPSRSHLMSTTEAEKIINDYGAAMMARSELFSDASALPYPKGKIEEALIAGIAATQDAKARDMLMGAYVTLADWQDGIGPGPHSPDFRQRLGENILATAKRIADAPSLTELPEKVAAEAQTLIAELKSLGL